MRRHIFIVILILTIGFKYAKGQENFSSAGTVLSLPIGDYSEFAEFGIGGFIKFEYGITENIGVGFGFDLNYFDPTAYGKKNVWDFSLLIPAKGFFRYYLIEQRKGPFISLKTGFYPMITYSNDRYGFGNTNFDLGWGVSPELGVYIYEGIGVAFSLDLFYNGSIIKSSSSEPLNYLSFRTFASF